MARRNRRRSPPEPPGPSGFLVVDKPAGVTSHDVVDAARRWLGTRRVGHLGTLDPQATGVLPLAVRAATKLIPFVGPGEGGVDGEAEAAEKGYDGTIVLGVRTDTLDREGEVVERFEGALPGEAEVRAALATFRGDVQQVPPMYSAVKKDGVPLHKLARQGREVEREPKWVTISDLEMTRFAPPELDVRVACSAGTYVRVLAADLGERLGCGAHLGRLRRTRSGPFTLDVAHDFERLEAACKEERVHELLVPPEEALGFPVQRVTGELRIRLQNGGDLPAGELHRAAPGTRVSILGGDGAFLAVGEIRGDRRIWPLRVLPPEPT